MGHFSSRRWLASFPGLVLLAYLLTGARVGGAAAATFKLATYNLENYLLVPSGTRPAKSPESRVQVCKALLQIRPDVLALQEVGETNAFLELQSALKTGGLDLPYREYVAGSDPDLHVAVLSRFPFSARQPHTQDSFLLSGRRFMVSRGFVQVTITVSPDYSFTLLVAHLKSKRTVATADQGDLRLEEAKILRKKIDVLLQSEPTANVIVVGDLNDTQDSLPVRALIGRGKTRLVDVRPAEQNGDNPQVPGLESRSITWTEHYAKEDTFSRIDYILLSSGMNRELEPAETCVFAIPNWGLASDHRPLVATFYAVER